MREGSVFLRPGQVVTHFTWTYSESDKIFLLDDRLEAAEGPGGPAVVNIQNEFILGLEVGLWERLSLLAEVPFEYNNRSLNAGPASGGRLNGRLVQQSAGLADTSVLLRYWLLPEGTIPGNVAFEAGFKAPTGDESVYSVFNGERLAHDVSVQRGTGSWDPLLGAAMFFRLGPAVPFASLRYRMTPSEDTGVPALHPQLVDPNTPITNSIPDQINWRVGVSLDSGLLLREAIAEEPIPLLDRLRLSLSLTGSHIPEEDLVGGSDGFRRSFDALFIEPGLEWGVTERLTLHVNAPVTVHRRLTGAPGTFPDFQLNVGFSLAIN